MPGQPGMWATWKRVGKGSGGPGSLLQAQESHRTKSSLFPCFHSTRKTALFLLRTDTPALFPLRYQAEITYSVHLSLSPCNARRSFHTLSPTPVVPGWDPLQPMPLSLSLSLSVPPPRCKTKDPQGQHVPTSALTRSMSPAQPPLRPLWWAASFCGRSLPRPPPACLARVRAPQVHAGGAGGPGPGPQPPLALTVCAAAGGRAGGRPSGSSGRCRAWPPSGCGGAGPGRMCWRSSWNSEDTCAAWQSLCGAWSGSCRRGGGAAAVGHDRHLARADGMRAQRGWDSTTLSATPRNSRLGLKPRSPWIQETMVCPHRGRIQREEL